MGILDFRKAKRYTDKIINESTPLDSMARLAAVNVAGVDKSTLKARIDDDYNYLAPRINAVNIDPTTKHVRLGTEYDYGHLTLGGYLTILHPTVPEIHFGNANYTGYRSWWAIGIDQADDVQPRDFVVCAKGYAFNVTDASITSGSTTLTSAQANFTSLAVGFNCIGAGIPAGTTIVSITDSSHVVMSAAATATSSDVLVAFNKDTHYVNDSEYWSHNGFGAATVGFGYPQPPADYRMRIRGSDRELTQGTLKIHTYTGQTGNLLSIDSTAANDTFKVTPAGATVITGSAGTNTPFLVQNNTQVPVLAVYNATTSFNVGIGTATPSGKLHVQLTANTQTANSNANALVLGTNGSTGMTILSSNTGWGTLYFGDTDSATVGRIFYDHSVDAFKFYTNGNPRVTIGATLELTSQSLLGTPKAGAIEYDGTNLYFTTSAGVRKTITAV